MLTFMNFLDRRSNACVVSWIGIFLVAFWGVVLYFAHSGGHLNWFYAAYKTIVLAMK